MAGDACSDTGPLLHLHEIHSLHLLRIFDHVFISPYVQEELRQHDVQLPPHVAVKAVDKDYVALLAEKYGLAIAETSVLWLGKSLRVSLLLTDDLEARQVAAEFGLQPVGSVGIIIRAFRERKLTEEKAVALLQSLQKGSSLFVTSSLIRYAIDEMRKFAKSGKKR